MEIGINIKYKKHVMVIPAPMDVSDHAKIDSAYLLYILSVVVFVFNVPPKARSYGDGTTA